MLRELTKNFKNCHFEMSSFILCNKELFHGWIVTCDEKWILYNWQQPVQWLDWEEAPKHFPKLKLAPKKGHGHCLMVCCPSDPLQLSGSWRNHYVWEICSANWQQHQKLQCLQLALVNRKGPILLKDNAWPHLAQPTLQKLNELGYRVLPHLPYSPDLLPTH